MVRRFLVLGLVLKQSSSASVRLNTGATTINIGKTINNALLLESHFVMTAKLQHWNLLSRRRNPSMLQRLKHLKQLGHCQVSGTYEVDNFCNALKQPCISTDTYTEDELIRGSTWFLQSSHGTKLQIHTALRDRCMLLISSSSAFHGNNVRSLLLSDLAVHDVPMLDIGPGVKAMVCAIQLSTATLG
jgi:hypothetical protein